MNFGVRVPRIARTRKTFSGKAISGCSIFLCVGSCLLVGLVAFFFVVVFWQTGNDIAGKSFSLYFYHTFNDWERYTYIVLEWVFAIISISLILFRVAIGFGLSSLGILEYTQQTTKYLTVTGGIISGFVFCIIFFVELIPQWIHFGANERMMRVFYDRFKAENYNTYVPPKEIVYANVYIPPVLYIFISCLFYTLPCMICAFSISLCSYFSIKGVTIPHPYMKDLAPLRSVVIGGRLFSKAKRSTNLVDGEIPKLSFEVDTDSDIDSSTTDSEILEENTSESESESDSSPESENDEEDEYY